MRQYDESQLLRFALDCAQTAIAVARPCGELSYVNPAFLQLWRIDAPESAVGRRGLSLWSDQAAAAATMAEILARGQWRGRLVALREDGVEFPVFVSAHAVRTPSGDPIALMGSFVDLSELESAQAVAERQRGLVESIAGAAPVIILSRSVDGIVQHINPFFERLTGFSSSEAIGRDWIEAFVAQRCQEAMRRCLDRVIGDGSEACYVCAIRTHDDREREIEWFETAAQDETGQVRSLLAFGLDVTDRVRAEAALARRADLSRACLSLSERFETAGTPQEVAHILQGVMADAVGIQDVWIVCCDDEPPGWSLAASDGPNVGHLSEDDAWREIVDRYCKAVKAGTASVSAPAVIRGDDASRGRSAKDSRVPRPCATILVPLLAESRRLGALGTWTLQRDQGEGPSGEQLDFLVHAASRVAAALDRILRTMRLEAIERRLNQAQAIAQIGSWELDLRKNQLFWSDEIFRIFEIDRQRFVASYESFLALVHPDDRLTLDCEFRQSVQERRPYVYRHRLLMADGRTKWVEERGETEYSAAGEPERSIGTVQDITDRVALEEARRRTEERFTLLHESLMDAYFQVDDQGRVVDSNEAFQRLVEYSAEELRQLTNDRLTAPRWLEQETEIIVRQVLERGFSDPYEKEFVRRDGAAIPVEVRSVSLRGADGRSTGFWFLVRDISMRKAGQQKLEAALAEKQFLLKEVYHRVKNNLQVVTSLLNLQARSIADQRARRLLEDSVARVQTMAVVHEQLYRAPDLAHVDLGRYLRQLARHLVAAHRPTSVDVPTFVRVSGDIALDLDRAVPCGLIVNELVSNAYKHGFALRNSGSIEISADLDEAGLVRLTVEDDGVGVPDGFDLHGGGSLGLQLVRTLAAQLDGEVRVEARRPGTRYEVRLPAAGRPTIRRPIPPPPAELALSND